jgi:hypothetical protein
MDATAARRGAIGIVLLLATCAQARAQTETQTVPAPKPNAGTTAPAPAPAGTPALVVDQQVMDTVNGKKVRSANGEDLGRLIDVMVESNGQVRAAIIDFGGVLGVGSRKVAVDWKALDFKQTAKSGTITLTLTRDQIRTAPEYRPGEPTVILQAPKSPEASSPPNSSHR